MISREIIDSANSVSVLDIADHFGYEIKSNKISCPLHNEETPSCGFFPKKNIFHCFGCNENLGPIRLFMELSKANGRPVSFQQAVNDILEIGEIGHSAIHTVNTHQKKKESAGNEELYNRILNNCKPIQNYELQYLADRGIFINGGYVYEGKAYLKGKVDYHIRTAKYEYDRQFWQAIKDKGVYHSGISSSFLEANNIEILHNYFNSTNYIIYKIEYDEFIFNDDAKRMHVNLDESGGRKMLIQKSLNGLQKRNIGMTDFTLLVNEANDNENVFVVEGLEDAFSVIQLEGAMVISLNSTSNLQSLMESMEDIKPCSGLHWHICLDHDEAGQTKTNELTAFFDSENKKFIDMYPQLAKKAVKANGGKVQSAYPYYYYSVHDFPMEYKDINEYLKSIIFGK